MFRLKRFSLIMIILTGLLLPGPAARATVDVTTSFVSERKTTLISLHHEDASPMPLLIAELAQNVDALDNLFQRLQNDGQLLPSHPVLAIKISDDAYQRVLSGPRADGYAVLSLEKDYRRDLDPHDILSADAVAFGPVYRIELALWPVSINELFALVLLLPELSAENPRKELLAAGIRQYSGDMFDVEIARIAGEWSYSDLLWSPDGNILLSAVWINRRLQYQAFNFSANEPISLEPLEHYILPPTFSPDSRYIVYSSQAELRIVDVNKHRTTGFSLRKLIPGDYQFISRVEFAVNKTGDILFFDPWGWGMPYPSPKFLWRSANPEQLEKISGLGVMEKPDLPGEIWSDNLHRWHAATVRAFTRPAELKKEDTADSINPELAANREKLQAKYGAIYSETINYPRNDYLAVLIEDGNRLKARVFSLPSLEERLIYAFAFMSGPEIPGRIAGISLFNVAVVVLMLLMAAGIARLIISVKQKYGRPPAAPMSKRKKFLLFAVALLITLLLHFAATIAAIAYIDDDMWERAARIAQQAIQQKYAGLNYTVKFTEGFKNILGSSPLWFSDFPYQVLYWRLSGFTRFAAPIEVGFGYRVYDRQRYFVKRKAGRYYVLGENRIVLSHLPWQKDKY